MRGAGACGGRERAAHVACHTQLSSAGGSSCSCGNVRGGRHAASAIAHRHATHRPEVATERGMWSSSSIICGWVEWVQGGARLHAQARGRRRGNRRGRHLVTQPSTELWRSTQTAAPAHLRHVVLIPAVVAPRLGLKEEVAGCQLKHHAGQGPDVG